VDRVRQTHKVYCDYPPCPVYRPIHPSACKRESANYFARTEFFEVRNTKQRTTHIKDSPYWGWPDPHKPATLPSLP
jgi:hypothetical protein